MPFKMFQNVIYAGPPDFAPGLAKGEIGTVLEVYKDGAYEVEFINDDGSTKILQGFPESYLQPDPGGYGGSA